MQVRDPDRGPEMEHCNETRRLESSGEDSGQAPSLNFKMNQL